MAIATFRGCLKSQSGRKKPTRYKLQIDSPQHRESYMNKVYPSNLSRD